MYAKITFYLNYQKYSFNYANNGHFRTSVQWGFIYKKYNFLN